MVLPPTRTTRDGRYEDGGVGVRHERHVGNVEAERVFRHARKLRSRFKVYMKKLSSFRNMKGLR